MLWVLCVSQSQTVTESASAQFHQCQPPFATSSQKTTTRLGQACQTKLKAEQLSENVLRQLLLVSTGLSWLVIVSVKVVFRSNLGVLTVDRIRKEHYIVF